MRKSLLRCSIIFIILFSNAVDEMVKIYCVIYYQLKIQSQLRFFLVNVYSPENLEITLLSLNNTLMENPSISAVFILGVNAFYHQVIHFHAVVSLSLLSAFSFQALRAGEPF